MKDVRELLGEHDFFADMDPSHLDLMAGCGHNVTAPAGDLLIREGEPAGTFYALREGKVALEVNIPHRGPITIATVGPGEVLGVSWLFPPFHWQFDGHVVEPVHAVALDGVCLRGKCQADTGLGFDLMQRFAAVLAGRLHATRVQLVDLYGHETP